MTFNDVLGNATRVNLAEGETLIGRGTSCHIMMNVASVSRQHARLRVTGGRCTLSDAGSSFGTQVKGAPLKGEADLKAGDVFHCGAVAFTVEESLPASPLLTDDHQLLEGAASIVAESGNNILDGVNRLR